MLITQLKLKQHYLAHMIDRVNRVEKRVSAMLPVNLEGGAIGLSRDVSASGIFFEIDIDNAPDSLINFTLEFEGPGGGMTLKCKAQVLRVERLQDESSPNLKLSATAGKRVGIAAKIIESKFEARP